MGGVSPGFAPPIAFSFDKSYRYTYISCVKKKHTEARVQKLLSLPVWLYKALEAEKRETGIPVSRIIVNILTECFTKANIEHS